jgi:hypothetical protein
VNRALIRRLLNEYLDGEIGLADKAELERLMAADPTLRKEYQELRRVSLLLNSQPEIVVHPYRFRQKLLSQLNAPARLVLTPQRAFAGSMLVALLVITLTFGLVMYQEKLLGGWQPALMPQPTPAAVNQNDLKLYIPVSAEAYFDRLLLETQLGLLDQSAVAPFIAQTTVYEGAICTPNNGLHGVRFAQPLPAVLRINVTARQAFILRDVALELSGDRAQLALSGSAGNEIIATPAQYFKLHNEGEQVRLYLEFN